MTRKIGVYVCECGTNIADGVDMDAIIDALSSHRDVEVVEKGRLLCSGDGTKSLTQSIQDHGLTHLVVAACSPTQHEGTFMNVCDAAGLNPYLFQMVNIREQGVWVTPNKEEATDKAIRQISAAIGRVRYHTALKKEEMECSPDVLVVGGGIAGMRSCLLLASPKRKVYLVEKTSSLGGKTKGFAKLFTNMANSGAALIEQAEQAIRENENIEVFTDSEVEEILGFFGNFEVKVVKKAENEEQTFGVGAVVLATGFTSFDPEALPQYGYRRLDDVYTALEFEEMNLSGGKILLKNGKPPGSVAIIHCVGRAEKGYCSKVCCLYALKFARMLKSELPGVNVAQFHSDLCIPGKSYQRFFEETKASGVEFVRADRIEVAQAGNGMAVKFETEGGGNADLAVDMVILVSAMEPSSDTQKFAEMLNISQDDEGFLAEEHRLLSPVSSSVEGVFVVGCAQGPKSIAESIIQSEAAAGKILSSLVPGRKLELEVRTSEISETFCMGCKTCLTVCSYSAITFDEMKNISVVNEVLCHGCGACAAACPSGAASVKNFAFTQIYHEVAEILK